MKAVNVSYEVVVPDVPDMLAIAGSDGVGVPVGSITEDGLRAIGRQWTENLLQKALGLNSEKPAAKKPSRRLSEGKRNSGKRPKIKYIKSRYKGIRGCPSGKWEAKYYDKAAKKIVYLGMFDSELLAAAMVQEKMGNKKEAAKLRNEFQESDGVLSNVNSGMDPGDYQG